MNATVTARIPVEIRNQAHEKLRAAGLTPTELINHAYRMFLATGTLPEIPNAHKRTHLSEQEIAEFSALLKETTFELPAQDQAKTFDELREEAMHDRFPEYWS